MRSYINSNAPQEMFGMLLKYCSHQMAASLGVCSFFAALRRVGFRWHFMSYKHPLFKSIIVFFGNFAYKDRSLTTR